MDGITKAWESFVAQGQPQNAVGTLDELNKHKLPTRAFPCCAEPSNDETVKGCPLWHTCDMSYKGLPASEGGGPRNHAWEHLKNPGNGGGVVRSVMPCFWGVAKQENVSENKEVLRVIADEGGDYEMLTWLPDPTGGRNNDGFLKWEKKLVPCKVPAFMRIGEEPKLIEHELRASIVERERKRIANEREAGFIGIERTGASLDKRDRRQGKVGPPEGK